MKDKIPLTEQMKEDRKIFNEFKTPLSKPEGNNHLPPLPSPDDHSNKAIDDIYVHIMDAIGDKKRSDKLAILLGDIIFGGK